MCWVPRRFASPRRARSGWPRATTSSRATAFRRPSSRSAVTPSSPSRLSACRSIAGARRPTFSPPSTPGGARISRPGARASSTPMRSARRSGSSPISTQRSDRSSVTAQSRRSMRFIARREWPCRRPLSRRTPGLRSGGRTSASSPAPSLSRRPPPPRARGSSASATIPMRWRAAGCRCGETGAGEASTAALRSPTTPTGRASSRPSRRRGRSAFS